MCRLCWRLKLRQQSMQQKRIDYESSCNLCAMTARKDEHKASKPSLLNCKEQSLRAHELMQF